MMLPTSSRASHVQASHVTTKSYLIVVAFKFHRPNLKTHSSWCSHHMSKHHPQPGEQSHGRYTASGIGTIYHLLPNSFGPLPRKAAARALLRRDTNIDGTHPQVKREGGLHPSFVALHGVGEGKTADERMEVTELLEGSLADLFDAVRHC